LEVVRKGKVLQDSQILSEEHPEESKVKLILVIGNQIANTIANTGHVVSKKKEVEIERDGCWRWVCDTWLHEAQFRCGADVYLERRTDTMVLERALLPNKEISVTMIETMGKLYLRVASQHISLVDLEEILISKEQILSKIDSDLVNQLAASGKRSPLLAPMDVAGPVPECSGAVGEDGYNEVVQAFRARLTCTTPLDLAPGGAL